MLFGLSVVVRRRADYFVEDRYGPTERLRRQAAYDERPSVKWWRWFKAQRFMMKVLVILAFITIGYFAFVFGLVAGLVGRISLNTL